MAKKIQNYRKEMERLITPSPVALFIPAIISQPCGSNAEHQIQLQVWSCNVEQQSGEKNVISVTSTVACSLVWVFLKLLIIWDCHMRFNSESNQKQKTSIEQQFCGQKSEALTSDGRGQNLVSTAFIHTPEMPILPAAGDVMMWESWTCEFLGL